MRPLVEQFTDPGLYSVRLSAKLEVMRIVRIVLITFMNGVILYNVSTEIRPQQIVAGALLLMVFGALMIKGIHGTLRACYGRVLVDSRGEELVFKETFTRFRSTLRIPRASVHGFWVAGVVDDGHPLPMYAVMLDRDGCAKVCVIPEIQLVRPAIALAEDLAKRMHVSADTRGGDRR